MSKVKFELGLAYRVYGKRWKDLTPEEKFEYNKIKASETYHSNPNRQQEYNKKYKSKKR